MSTPPVFPCQPPTQIAVMGPRLRAIIIFWTFLTTNDCFTLSNPGISTLLANAKTLLPDLTDNDLVNIKAALDQDDDGAFQTVRNFYSSVLLAGPGNYPYSKSKEARDNAYSDHNCPSSIDEVINALKA